MFNLLKKIGLWLRLALLMLTLLGGTVFMIWHLEGQWVNQVDEFVVKSYTDKYMDRLNHATDNGAVSSTESIVLLAELQSDLSNIYKGYRLAGIKRKAFHVLVEILYDAGKYGEALVWAERWVEFDNRDLLAQVWLVKLMREMPSRYEESWLLIKRLYHKIPSSNLIATEYVEFLIQRQEFADAFIAAFDIYERQEPLIGKPWQIFWDTGDGFNGVQGRNVFPSIDDVGGMSFRLDVPSGVKQLRIDPPALSRINLMAPMLVDGINGGNVLLDFLNAPVSFTEMFKGATGFQTEGKWDPSFCWDMSSVKDAGGKLFFTCTIEKALPDILGKIIQDYGIDSLTKDLLSRHQYHLVEQLKLFVGKFRDNKILLLYQDAFLQVFYRENNESFSEKKQVRQLLHGRVVGGEYIFDTSFPLEGGVSQIRIDFPSIKGQRYIFKSLILFAGGKSYPLNIVETTSLELHMLGRQGDVFKVKGDDPYFIFAVPPSEVSFDRIFVKGAGL